MSENKIISVAQRFTAFITDFKQKDGSRPYEQQLHTLGYRNTKPLTIDFYDLYNHDDELARRLIDNPRETLREALKSTNGNKVQVRHLPVTTPIREVNTEKIGRFIMVHGIVVKAGQQTSKISRAVYECTGCGELLELEQRHQFLEKPDVRCRCESRVKNWRLNLTESNYVDCQTVNIQESPDQLPPGEIPNSLEVELNEELVGSAKPGDRVKVTGLIHVKMGSPASTKLELSRYLIANHVEVVNKEEEALSLSKADVDEITQLSGDPWIMRRIVMSVAPSIYGYHHIKKAITLMLFGSDPIVKPDIRIRGDINVLLVGDPGTSKTQLLMYASTLSSRGIFTTGRGSSSAGLTAAVIKDKGGGFTLEAGALVLADKGLCCIAKGQKVITSKGIKEIELVSKGDNLKGQVDKRLIYQPVLDTHMNGIKSILEINLYTGDIIKCTPDHKILTQKGWVKAEDLKVGDYTVIPCLEDFPIVTDKDSFERGFIDGFSLSDVILSENKKYLLAWTSSIKNRDRSLYIKKLIEYHYGVKVYEGKVRPKQTVKIRGKKVTFSETRTYSFKSKVLKNRLMEIFKHISLPEESVSYRIGFLTGILSTDTCISHKKGSNGIKHVINIGLGRKKYDFNWLSDIMNLVCTMFHDFGIMAIKRKRKIMITSVRSYNLTYKIFYNHIFGLNKNKLYRVKSLKKVTSYDSILDDTYFNWFKSIKFNTTKTVKLGLHSRIWYSIKKNRITVELMETLKPYWSEITNEKYREPLKPYLLNRIESISEIGTSPVYDLTINGEPNYQILGGIVHNCIDEMEKMDDTDREAIHPAMEQQVVPINKGGINAILNARCSILAAANPTLGRYNPYQTVAENIGKLPVTLLSRFDLIFIIRDLPEQERDRAMGEVILSIVESEGLTPIPFKTLKKYIGYSKQFNPEMGRQVSEKLLNFYVDMRKQNHDSTAVSITPRQLESLLRLTKAHARAHLREHATEEDADAAIDLFKRSMEQVGIDAETGKIDIDLLEVGKPKSLQDRLLVAFKVVGDICAIEGVAHEDAVKKCLTEDYGMSESDVVRLIGVLMTDGTIYSPRPGYFKRT